MNQDQAVAIAVEFMRNNAKVEYGAVVRVGLAVDLDDQVKRIEVDEINAYRGHPLTWMIVFDGMDPESIPKGICVDVDDSTGVAQFFKTL